jgi:LuxR family maltose regulon positive regulatory protein
MQAFVHRQTANFGQLLQTGRSFLQAAEETKLQLSIAWANYHLGWLFYEWNELETAERHLLEVIKHRYHAHQLALRDSFMGLALIYLAWGETAKVSQTLTALAEYARQADNPMFLITYHAFAARIRLQQGDIEAAIEEAEVAMAGGQPGPLPFFEHAALTRARVLIWQGRGPDVEEALILLDRWQPLIEQSHNTLRLIEILALRALAGHKSGQPQAALACLEQAVTLARPGRLIRTFVDLGPAMVPLLEQLARRGVEPGYVAQLLAAWSEAARLGSDSSPVEPDVDYPLDSLTNRELEVLELLQQRLTNQEIAEALFISPLTVKSHARTIYQKLGVKNRRQAVMQAVKQGILLS